MGFKPFCDLYGLAPRFTVPTCDALFLEFGSGPEQIATLCYNVECSVRLPEFLPDFFHFTFRVKCVYAVKIRSLRECVIHDSVGIHSGIVNCANVTIGPPEQFAENHADIIFHVNERSYLFFRSYTAPGSL